MATQTEMRKAFEKADAILRLEGFEPTNTGKSLQDAVVRGQMTSNVNTALGIGRDPFRYNTAIPRRRQSFMTREPSKHKTRDFS